MHRQGNRSSRLPKCPETCVTSFRRLVAPVFGLVGARLAGAGFGFLSQLLLARTFSPHDVGIAFLALSITSFVSLLITCGYYAAGVTALVRFHALGRKTLIDAYLFAARRDMNIGAIVAVAIAFALLLAPLPDDVHETILLGTLGAVPLAVIRLNNVAANAQKRFALSYTPEFVARPGLLLLVVGAIVLFGMERDIHILLVAIVLICVGVAVWQAIQLGTDNAYSSAVIKPRRDLRPYYRKRAVSMLMVIIVAGSTADLVVMLGGVFLSTSDVAVLGVSVRIAALVGFFSAASQQFVLRDLATAMTKLTRSDVDSLLLRTNLAGLWTMVGALVVCVAFGTLLLSLFGPEYQSGYWPLLIFLLSQAVRVLGGMNGHLLALGGHQVRSAAICLGAVAVLIIMASILTPLMGLTGMALATLAAELFWAVGLALLTQRLEGRRGDIMGLVLAR